MTKLGLIDQALFKLEQGGMSPLYMGGGMILDPSDSPYPVDAERLAGHLAAIMEEIPLMRQKLVQDKFRIGNMRLVDDPDFDVNYHITLSRLEAPGGYDELMTHMEYFSIQRLDLNRPLWHFDIVEGLEGGRIALATHIHHSILDGIGAQRALGSMWSEEPIPARLPRKRRWKARKEPESLALIKDALLENAKRLYIDAPSFVLNNASPMLQVLKNEIGKRIRVNKAEEDGNRSALPQVHKTSLNIGHLSNQRSVSYVELPLAEIKALRKAHDCTINDLALLINSYALCHYFESIGETIDFDLVAGMPINLRGEGDKTAGNAVSIVRVNLHNTIREPLDRLQAIANDTRAIKQQAKGEPAQPGVDLNALQALFSPVILDAVFLGVARFDLMGKVPFANVAITNVPGSPKPMYLAGAKVVSSVPMAPCSDGVALTVTVSSDEGNLLIGYHGCGETIKNKALLVEGARLALDKLKSSAKRQSKKRGYRK